MISKAFHDFLKEEELLDQEIYVIGADETNVNAGEENCAIHYLERMLGKLVRYFICQLHGNDLPFRAVFEHYDGKTKGPVTWTGTIGKALQQNLSVLPEIAF